MIIRPGSKLEGLDGELGTVTAVLIDPAAGAATHIAATIDDVPGSERLVPIELLTGGATAQSIAGNLDRQQFAGLPVFEVLDFVPAGADGEAGRGWLASYARPRGSFAYALHDAVPAGEAEIRRHLAVRDRNGQRIGTVGEVVLEGPSGTSAELVLHDTRHGEVHIPLSVIAGVDDGVIHLSVERTELARRGASGR
ncbi:MAG: PRC-barrel domain-containing protein [Acidimicrobiia bacterium]